MITISNQQIIALNDATDSENRMHSDEVAARYGFKGALVSGVNVFGYLTQPLVKAFGAGFLDQGILDVLFLKPAYQDELLTITTTEVSTETTKRNCLTHAHNEEGQLLAKLESWLPAKIPDSSPRANMVCIKREIERPEISWDLIEIDSPAPAYTWQPNDAENSEHVNVQRDQSSCYQGHDAYIHPYYLLDACNKALMRMFVLPAWIHVGSKITIHSPLKVNQDIEVKTVPIEKWKRKGHEFIKLYIAMCVDERVAIEVEHTAIFKIAT